MTRLFQLHVSLDDSEPLIWRRALVPSAVRLARLHRILQAVMGWENCHLHQFHRGGLTYGIPDDEFPAAPGFRDESGYSLHHLLRQHGDTLGYEYDFGDSWMHTLTLELITHSRPGLLYPHCTEGAHACPPEDCGGIPGYYEYLADLADPSREGHAQAIAWRGPTLNPEEFSPAKVNARLHPSKRTTGDHA